MVALRAKKKVTDGKVVIEIPEGFGNEVEVIVLAEGSVYPIEYWTSEEIAKLGKITGLISDNVDKEDYSKW